MHLADRLFSDPDTQIRAGWITAVVVGSITALFALLGTLGRGFLTGMVGPSEFWDAALLFGLAYGVYRRSRVAAVALLAYWIAGRGSPWSMASLSEAS
jgi:hypothetical protein